MNLYCHSVMTFFSRIRKYFTAKNKKAVDYLRSGGRLGLWPMSGTNERHDGNGQLVILAFIRIGTEPS